MNNKCVDCNKDIANSSTRCRSCSKKGNDSWKNRKRHGPHKQFTKEELFKRKRCQNIRLQVPFEEVYDVVWNKSPNECYYCKEPIDKMKRGGFQIDHKIPLKRGGPRTGENLCVTCQFCNSLKGMMTDSEWFNCIDDLKKSGYWAENYSTSDKIGHNQHTKRLNQVVDNGNT